MNTQVPQSFMEYTSSFWSYSWAYSQKTTKQQASYQVSWRTLFKPFSKFFSKEGEIEEKNDRCEEEKMGLLINKKEK